jgi:D-glycero-D-manno-heptose 1,7-bisphosphate phosphatase
VTEAAIFLDRDGVINRRRVDHVKSWDEFEFLPEALEGLREINRVGAPVVVVTNQSAVGRGLLSEADLGAIHERMLSEVAAAGGRIDAIYACLHTPFDGCDCRKPAPGLIMRATADLGLRIECSVMVGDSVSDIQAARAAGCTPVLLRGGAGEGVPTAPDLRQAAALVASLLERLQPKC